MTPLASAIELALEALEPFARAVKDTDEPSTTDNTQAWESSLAMAVSYGDLRRAAETYTALKSLHPVAGEGAIRQVAWLLERPATPDYPATYWNPDIGWTIDPKRGIWFARKFDAESYKASRNVMSGASWIVSTEHVFGLSSPAPQPNQEFSSLPPTPLAEKWLPIASAPGDGTPVLLVTAKQGGPGAWWGYWAEGDAQTQDGKTGWADGSTDSFDDLRIYDGHREPSHWMPLPPPPTSCEREGER